AVSPAAPAPNTTHPSPAGRLTKGAYSHDRGPSVRQLDCPAMRDADLRPRTAALALVALIAVGGAIRFATLGDRSFWVDEAATVRLMNSSFGHMLNLWRVHEDTPPLY